MSDDQLRFNLEDPTAAAAARDAGIEAAAAHANPTWSDTALDAVHVMALHNPDLTTDDVWRWIGDAASTRERRAMGAVMRQAATLGWIRPSAEHRPSARVVAHRNPKRVWISQIYERSREP